jgi:hypothetical protein
MTRLSVVVTVVDGGETLLRCLTALATQQDPPRLEVLVPYDDTAADTAEFASRFPAMRFLPLGRLATQRPSATTAGQHEIFDRRRAAGLAAASGDLIAILEDRGVPQATWARAMVEESSRHPGSVIGGAIDNGTDRPLNWAVFYCDFGRYQPPLSAGTRAYVSDVNVCYPRPVLEQVRPLWRERYHETTVHWALRRAGVPLHLSPRPVVVQRRDGLTTGGLLRERVGWGRLFACTRAAEIGWGRRLLLAGLAPCLPVLLLARIVAGRLVRRRGLGRLAVGTPIVLLLLAGWSAGEFLGYLTGRD